MFNSGVGQVAQDEVPVGILGVQLPEAAVDLDWV
jgi:hypothetical protein